MSEKQTERQMQPAVERTLTFEQHEQTQIVYRATCSRCNKVWQGAQEPNTTTMDGVPVALYRVQNDARQHDCSARVFVDLHEAAVMD